MSKTHFIGDLLCFQCPGCGFGHCVTVDGVKNVSGATWTWNHNHDSPSFSPSVLVNAKYPDSRCHFFVRAGQIAFLSDCHHKLAGQTVDLPEWED